ncbi:MAG: hypothetical protein NTV36_02615, partial [Candidatus Staskawiczbacteria bacterium]|nr:hypothetical protein [Candidatus Staskawiczbacteria bacterium]
TGCVADYTTGTNIPGATAIQPWINDNNKNYLNINQKGFYNNGDESLENKPTKFKRKIIVTCLPTGVCANDYIMKVVVQVSWRQKASILNPNSALDANCTSYNCVTVESTLYDWYNYKDTHFKDTHL